MAITMAILFFHSKKTKNAGIVDLGWAFGLAGLAVLDSILGGGFPLRCFLIACMMGLANGRLGLHLFQRYRHEFPTEDPRYHQLREHWGIKTNQNFFGLFQLQGLLVALLSVPAIVASVNPHPGITILEWLALGLWLIALLGETMADQQLQQFKANEKNKGKTCTAGLWNYSRHPNYFFEWLLWIAYTLFALSSPNGWLALFCPLVMLFFLLQVTGVTATEAQALRTRADYKAYQASTSAFMPWFKRIN